MCVEISKRAHLKKIVLFLLYDDVYDVDDNINNNKHRYGIGKINGNA